MGQINLSLPSDGQSIDAADVNSPFNTIANEINGNLDNSNIASNAAIAGSKLASGGVDTTQLADDAVTAGKIDWATTGANGGIWWEELGRTTLGGAGDTISVTSLPARKYLRIIAVATGTNIRGTWQFNTDTGSNYAYSVSDNYGAVSATTGATSIPLGDAGANNVRILAILDVINIEAIEKLVSGTVVTKTATGDGTAPTNRAGSGTWDNTSDQISSVQFVNSSTGDFAAGSEVVVLGHD